MSFESFEILPELIPFLYEVKARGYLLIMITNQGGIAKKLYDHELVEKSHLFLSEELAGHSLGFDEIYYCPHHPLTGECLCRKPSGLLLEKSIARFDLDPSKCLMIGDKQRDVDAASSVGVAGFLVNSNPSLQELMNCLTA